MAVRGRQGPDEVEPGPVHGHLVEVAGRVLGRDQDHLRALGLGEAAGQFARDQRRGEILVLHVDAALRRADAGDVQHLVLAHLGVSAPGRLGAGNPGRDVGERRGDRPGPARPPHGRAGIDRLAGGPEPTVAEQLAEVAGGLAIDEAHHLVAAVEAFVVAAGLLAPGIVVQVLGGVPAIGPDVAAAAEGEGVIDDDHLLMVAGADGQLAVEDELHLGPGEDPAVDEWKEVLGRRHGHGRLPAQDAHIDLGIVRQGDEEGADAVAVGAAAARPGMEQGVGLEGPVQQVHAAPGPAHGVHGGVEIGLHVDQQRRAIRAPDPPSRGLVEQTHAVSRSRGGAPRPLRQGSRSSPPKARRRPPR